MAAYLGMAQTDLADEALQIGLGYVYARRRANLGDPFIEIPEIWQKLDSSIKELRSLRGTEFPPL